MIRSWIKKQEFQPGCFGFLVNPFFFVRRGLSTAVAQYAHSLNVTKFLDLGCGHKPYRALFSVQEYVGVDIENPGHPHPPGMVDVYYNGRTLPFPDQTFDAGFSSEVLEHVEQLQPLLQEVARVLKPGAPFFVSAPLMWSEHEMPHDYRRFTLTGLQRVLLDAGFEIVKTEKSTTDIETCFQALAMLIANAIGKGRITRWLSQLLLIAPLLCLGIILSAVFPNSGIFYSNAIVTARKKN